MAAQTKKKKEPLTPPKMLEKFPFYGYELDDEQLLFANSIWDSDKDIVFCNAKAGTGKTFVATGVANMLVKYGFYKGIVYIMSPYGERKQGWLPGTITEKSSVYFEAFYQALINCDINPSSSINDDSMVNQKTGSGYITCITDTFLRGSTLDNSVIIIDEAQNYTTAQLKKTLTRVGNNSKVIVIGHDLQCDLDKPETSGFIKYLNHFAEQERAAVCSLTVNHRSWISQYADELEE
jgi:phosphate starvation-inducible protein PhoH